MRDKLGRSSAESPRACGNSREMPYLTHRAVIKFRFEPTSRNGIRSAPGQIEDPQESGFDSGGCLSQYFEELLRSDIRFHLDNLVTELRQQLAAIQRLICCLHHLLDFPQYHHFTNVYPLLTCR